MQQAQPGSGAPLSLLEWIKANKISFAAGTVVAIVVIYGLYSYMKSSVPEPTVITAGPGTTGADGVAPQRQGPPAAPGSLADRKSNTRIGGNASDALAGKSTLLGKKVL